MSNATSQATENLQRFWHQHQLSDSGWLSSLQRQAIERFGHVGFPTTRDESWKYTDVSKLAQLYPGWLVKGTVENEPTARKSLDIADAIHLVFADGIFQPGESSRDLPEGLLAGNLAELARTHCSVIEPRFGRLMDIVDSAFAALNTAFASVCTVLVLPAGTRLTRPVYIEYVTNSRAASSHPRLLADLGANSLATIIEHYTGAAATLTNAVAEMTIGRGARLEYYRLQESHAEAWCTCYQSMRLHEDASVQSMVIDSGALMSRNELYACLAGTGAAIEARGLLLGDGTRHVESRLTVEHAAPNTTSREQYRAILGDKSRGVFNGRILVQKPAQKTSAELSNRNLLLNRGAEINTKPELEIYADDVKCAHGSTTGQLDQTALFYLLSRGIDKQTARNLLVTAFASELLTNISLTAVAERTRDSLSGFRHTEA